MDRVVRLALVGDVAAAAEAEAEVDADRADRRLVAEAEAGRGPQRSQIEIADAAEDVAGIEEHDAAELAPEGRAQFGVQHGEGIAAGRKPVRIESPDVAEAVPGKTADRVLAAGEEPLARRQVGDDLDDGLAIRPQD